MRGAVPIFMARPSMERASAGARVGRLQWPSFGRNAHEM